MRRWFLALVFPGVTACMFLVETEGLTGSIAEDGGPGDAPTDGREQDGGTDARRDLPPDASLDAPTDGRVTPCSGTHLFCDDFDEGTLEFRWDVARTEAGPLSLTTDRYVSASRSLLAVVQPGSGIRRTSLRKIVAVPSKRARFEVDVFSIPPSEGTYRQVDVLAVAMVPPAPGLVDEEIGLRYLRAHEMELEWAGRPNDGGVTLHDVAPVTFPRGRWVHVALDVDRSSAAAVGKLSIDGVLLATLDIATADLQAVELRVGPDFTDTAQVVWSMSFDNVVVDR